MKLALLLAGSLIRVLAEDRCVSVDSSRVLAGDVAPAMASLSALPADLVLGYAPAPGLARWWKAEHLRALASRHGATLDGVTDFCVQRPAAPIQAGEVASLLAALLPAGARLELVDYCRLPVPRGELRFSLQGLSRPPAPKPATVLMWRGRMVFDGNRSTPFWASVRIAVARKGFYAARRIEKGKVLDSDDIRLEDREESIFSAAPEAESSRLTGRISRRAISEGTALSEALLVVQKEVTSGQTVEVEVQSGTARLKLEALALSGGRSGERVLLRNTASGKQFHATVEGNSRAVLDLEDPHDDSRPNGNPSFSAVQPGRALAGKGARGAAQARQGEQQHSRPPDPGR